MRIRALWPTGAEVRGALLEPAAAGRALSRGAEVSAHEGRTAHQARRSLAVAERVVDLGQEILERALEGDIEEALGAQWGFSQCRHLVRPS